MSEINNNQGMMPTIEITEALTRDRVVFVDVRSPGEYTAGCLPNAINIPLFNDAERAVVGTIYKTKGKETAKTFGLSLVAQKLPYFIEQFKNLPRGVQLVVYCWRGGMRSKTAVTLLGLADVFTRQLVGGYKQYRALVLNELNKFEVSAEVVVLCGSTGSGKTELLNQLKATGFAVIDLEQLANHRGSAFGGAGLGCMQTAHNFDILLLAELKKYANAEYILVECESKRIGNVYIPDCLFSKMAIGKKILLRTDIDVRTERLVKEYTDSPEFDGAELALSLQVLNRKLGKNTYTLLETLLCNREYPAFTKLLLEKYYDHLYGYEAAPESEFAAVVDGNDLTTAAKAVSRLIEGWYGKTIYSNN
ncbi:MAG: tRNA 2-selenouridine(34) synthase MnmH [Negativicutes bacterium]